MSYLTMGYVGKGDAIVGVGVDVNGCSMRILPHRPLILRNFYTSFLCH